MTSSRIGPYETADILDGTVREYVAELERLGADAIASCGWLQQLLETGAVERAANLPSVAGLDSRHYVAGSMAPLVIDRCVVPEGQGRGVTPIDTRAIRHRQTDTQTGLDGADELCWAVYFVSKNDEFVLKNAEFCNKNEELCNENDEFCRASIHATLRTPCTAGALRRSAITFARR